MQKFICKICGRNIMGYGNMRSHEYICNDVCITNIITDYVTNQMSAHLISRKYNTTDSRIREILMIKNIPVRSLQEAVKLSHKTNPKRKMSSEHIANISKGRKRWCAENPEKHSWKSKDKFISVPCETFKTELRKKGISFIEEHSPIPGRFFSIDISFPDKKIGIEINGNQHYNTDGTLKKYYKDRHDLFTVHGWKLYEYHFSVVYDHDMMDRILTKLMTDNVLDNIDYSFYIKPKKVYTCTDCGIVVKRKSRRCKRCAGKECTKHLSKKPEYAVLMVDVDSMSMVHVGKKYGVSDNAVRKWIRSYHRENGIVSKYNVI